MIYLSKSVVSVTLRVNPNVNCELCVTVACQCRFINYNQHTTLVGDVDNGGSLQVSGGSEQEVYEKSLDLPLNFALNPKLL